MNFTCQQSLKIIHAFGLQGSSPKGAEQFEACASTV